MITKESAPMTAPTPKLLPWLSKGNLWPTINLEDSATEPPSDGSLRIAMRRPARFAANLWKLGWTDGRLGNTAPEILDPASYETHRKARDVALDEQLTEAQTRLTQADTRVAEVDAQAVAAGKPVTEFPGLTLLVVFASACLIADFTLNWSTLALAYRLDALWKELAICAGLIGLTGILKRGFDSLWEWPKTIRWTRLIATSVISALVVVTQLLIADTRARQIELQSADDAYIHYPPVVDGEVEQTARERTVKKEELRARVEQIAVERDWSAKLSFIGQALGYTLVAGYLLSEFFMGLSWRWRIRRPRRHRKRCRAEVSGLRRELDALRNGKEAPSDAALYAALYDHGRNRGTKVAWTIRDGRSVYEECRRRLYERQFDAVEEAAGFAGH